LSKSTQQNFSKNLRELREIAISLTNNRNIRVNYDSKAKNPQIVFEDLKTNKSQITLTLSIYPEWVTKIEPIAQKILDGDCGHECGHEIISKPIWERFNNWVTKIKRNRGYFNLAHHIVGIVEDKRVNYFITARWRHDIGKRLKLANLILKDSSETVFRNGTVQITNQFGDAPIIMSILSNQGIYEAEIPEAWQKLSKKGKEACERCLSILDDVQYKRLGIDVIRACQEIYDQIAALLPKGAENQIKIYIPARCGGQLRGEISDELKQQLEALVEAELKKEEEDKLKNLLEDLLRGEGAGEGTGEEIESPEPDFEAYQALVDRNKPEITRLLNTLKQLVKVTLKRDIFQRRGRIMPSLQTKAYVNSLRQTVKDIYLSVTSQFEKEQVAIGFLFDFSGSVDRTEALDITTILTEVFGNYVDDYGYAVACFGANSQKIKTFFETYENTKARVGNIGVSPSGTEIHVLLTAFLKMFNNITSNRRKILVIASDFCFGDDSEARDIIRLYPKANVELIFIGFCNCENVNNWGSDLVKAKRTTIKEVSELPERFLEVYLNIQK